MAGDVDGYTVLYKCLDWMLVNHLEWQSSILLIIIIIIIIMCWGTTHLQKDTTRVYINIEKTTTWIAYILLCEDVLICMI